MAQEHKFNDLEQVPQEVRDQFERVNAATNANYEDLKASKAILSSMPVGRLMWAHLSQVQANDYNPNNVAHREMKLLHTSIEADGYTQPIVTIWDPEVGSDPACTCGGDLGLHSIHCDTRTKPGRGRYVIVDGFHRYTIMRLYEDVAESTWGYLPIVVIDKPIEDRIASTVRHNRARGKHSINGMSNLVFQMLTAGESDVTICSKLGLEAGELARLKHITGYSKLYKDQEYGTVTLTKSQMMAKAKYKKEHPDEYVPQV